MRPEQLIRAARRRCGLSQRAFAELAGLSLRALERVESGQSSPSWDTLSRAAEAAGLSVALVPEVPAAELEVQDFLRHSTSQRLRCAVGDRWQLAQELSEISRLGRVRLTGLSAVPVWLQGVDVPEPMQVHLHDLQNRPAVRGTRWEHLDEVMDSSRLPELLVAVGLRGGTRVWVEDPYALSLREDCAVHAQALRVAARCLDEWQARDGAGRTRPAHREPDETREAAHLWHVKAFRAFALPTAQDSRAWRVGGEVSLQQWTDKGRRETGAGP